MGKSLAVCPLAIFLRLPPEICNTRHFPQLLDGYMFLIQNPDDCVDDRLLAILAVFQHVCHFVIRWAANRQL